MDEILQMTGDRKTDSINRALQVYARLLKETNGEMKVWVQQGDRSIELVFV